MVRRTEGLSLAFLMLFSTLIFSHSVVAQPYQVNVSFWYDNQMTSPYINNFLTVYVENKTPTESIILGAYNYTCYEANYSSGIASIIVPETNYFDIVATDGAITWNNITGCPKNVQNYAWWGTVQSGIYVDHSMKLNYLINITQQQTSPRSIFGSTLSWKTLISVMLYIGILALAVVCGYFTKSGVIAVLVFVVLLIAKLAVGL